MTQISALLSGPNKNYDYQVTALARELINQGVFGAGDLLVTTNTVAVGEAFILLTRTNGQQIMAYYRNTASVTINTSGTTKVWLGVSQGVIDDGSSNAIDGSNIITIQTGANYPASNFLPLASVTGGVITDARPLVYKIPDSIQNQNYVYAGASSGAANTYNISPVPAVAAYATGQKFSFKSHQVNAGSSVVNVSGLGNKTIKKLAGNSDLVAGDIANGGIIEVEYDGVNFQMVSPVGIVPGGSKFGGTGVDGAIGAGALTITGSNNSYIEKNYTTFAPGANTVTITPTNCILHIKVQGNCDLTGTILNFAGKGAPGGAGSGPNTNGITGTNGNSNFPQAPLAGVGGTTGNSGGAGGLLGAAAAHSNATLVGLVGGRAIVVFTGAGGGGGGGGQSSGTGVAGGAGGGAVIFEVGGNLTFSGGSATAAGSNGTNGNAGGGNPTGGAGGGGGGGSMLFLYGGNLSGSITPTVTGGTGGTAGAGGGGLTSGGGGGGGGSFTNPGTAGTNGNTSNGGAGGNGGAGTFAIIKNTVLI